MNNEVPYGWKECKLGEICYLARGGSPRPIKKYITKSPDGINWIKIGDTRDVKKYIYETEEKIIPEGIKFSRVVEEGDFILSNSMSFGRPYVMKTRGCIHDGWLLLRPVKKYINRDFLYFLLSSQILILKFKKSVAGSTVKNLNIDLVKRLKVIVPPLPEQKQIVSIIEKWDKYIELLDKKIEIKKNTKKYLQQVLLTGKVRLKGYEGEWEEVLLEDICKILKGRELSKEKLVEDGKQECILYGELYTKYQEVIDTVVSRTDSTEGVKSKFGDILIPASTTTNALDVATASCLKKSDVLLGGDINIFRPNESVDGEYLAYLLSHTKKIDMAKLAQGITIVHLYGKDVKEIKISLPPLPEQKAISSILTKSDEEIKTLEKQKQLIEQQRKYLINNLVTGKIRIPKLKNNK